MKGHLSLPCLACCCQSSPLHIHWENVFNALCSHASSTVILYDKWWITITSAQNTTQLLTRDLVVFEFELKTMYVINLSFMLSLFICLTWRNIRFILNLSSCRAITQPSQITFYKYMLIHAVPWLCIYLAYSKWAHKCLIHVHLTFVAAQWWDAV